MSYYEALTTTATASAVVDVPPVAPAGQIQGTASILPLGPVLALAGCYQASPVPAPTANGQTSWAQFTNTTGLISGVTQLGDELSLLYRADTIANSIFATMLTRIWNGTSFA
jgi:hypothetical protein